MSNSNRNKIEVFDSACTFGYRSVINLILAENEENKIEHLSAYGFTGACRGGQIDIAQMMINIGCLEEAENCNWNIDLLSRGFFVAYENNHFSMCCWLWKLLYKTITGKEWETNILQNNNIPNKFSDLFKRYFDKGISLRFQPDIDFCWGKPASAGHLELVQFFDQITPPEQKVKYYFLNLYDACTNGHVNVMKHVYFLLKKEEKVVFDWKNIFKFLLEKYCSTILDDFANKCFIKWKNKMIKSWGWMITMILKQDSSWHLDTYSNDIAGAGNFYDQMITSVLNQKLLKSHQINASCGNICTKLKQIKITRKQLLLSLRRFFPPLYFVKKIIWPALPIV